MPFYHTAQVCLNGHLITESTEEFPDDMQKFCSKCGAQAVTTCPNCSASLHGYHDDPDFISITTVDSFCYNCGKPYPWTKSALESLQLLIEEEPSFSEDEKNKLVESVPDIISETPKTKVATSRFKRALSTAGKYTADAMKGIIVDIGTEVFKKSIGL